MRQFVTVTVKTMYDTSAQNVMSANHASYFTKKYVMTSPTSTSVGRMLYSEYEMSDWMPRVPRSMSRLMPPVWRSR